jgi:hypothetical protein
MTTINEKLLAKAAEYEEKARALRFAAAEMNGDAVEGKRKTALSVLDAAIALRNGQRNGHGNGHASANGNGNGQRGPQVGYRQIPHAEREATLRDALQAGPQSTVALRAVLAAHGQDCSKSWTSKLLTGMPDVHPTGKGKNAAWVLGKKDGRSTRPKTYVRKSTKAAVQATRARIFDVLGRYDRKTPKAPADVAKALGITVAQSGLAPLVHQKYLKKRKGGYIRTAKAYVVDEATEPAAS